jgi:hypothetical protein
MYQPLSFYRTRQLPFYISAIHIVSPEQVDTPFLMNEEEVALILAARQFGQPFAEKIRAALIGRRQP